MLKKNILLLSLLFMLNISPSWAGSQSISMSRVQFIGQKNIGKSTLLHYWEKYTKGLKSEADLGVVIRKLYALEFFSDIAIYKMNSTWQVRFKENPIIHSFHIEGHNELDKKVVLDLLAEYKLTSGRYYNPLKIQRLKNTLKKIYQSKGYFSVAFSDQQEISKSNLIHLKIQVKEGKQTKISQIHIEGNRYFSKYAILKTWHMSEMHFWSFFTQANVYNEQAREADMQALRALYLDSGFMDFKILQDRKIHLKNKRYIDLSIEISEGAQYVLNAFNIVAGSNMQSLVNRLQPIIKVKVGGAYKRKAIVQAAKSISKHLHDWGYDNIEVEQNIILDKQKKLVKVKLQLKLMRPTYIRSITFHGNNYSSDYVLRHQLLLREGDIFSYENMLLSQQRLNHLGYLKDIQIYGEPVLDENNQVDIHIHVKEKPSLKFSFNIGWVQDQGSMYGIDFSNNNFLGLGNAVSLSLQHTVTERDYRLYVTQPDLEHSGNALSYGVYMKFSKPGSYKVNTDSLYNSYLKDTQGAFVNYNYLLNNSWHFRAGLGMQKIKIKGFESSSNEVKDFLDGNGTKFNDTSVDASFEYNDLNQVILPSKGQYFSIGSNIHLPVFDDGLSYWKLNSHYVTYKPVGYQDVDKSFILKFGGELSYAQPFAKKSMPFFANYFTGGIGSVKGYMYGSLGPRDSLNHVIGGNLSAHGSAQLIAPSDWFSSGRISLFYDVGQVYQDKFKANKLRSSAGAMLELFTPIAPFIFSYAFPINAQPGDNLSKFQFSIGTELY
jgi:outer membrane protein insertion porin family